MDLIHKILFFISQNLDKNLIFFTVIGNAISPLSYCVRKYFKKGDKVYADPNLLDTTNVIINNFQRLLYSDFLHQ